MRHPHGERSANYALIDDNRCNPTAFVASSGTPPLDAATQGRSAAPNLTVRVMTKLARAMWMAFAHNGSTPPTHAPRFDFRYAEKGHLMFDQRMLRDVFGRFTSGVTVITCRNADGQPHGATVSAFTAVSMDPALCQVTVTRKSKACGYLSGRRFRREHPRRRPGFHGNPFRGQAGGPRARVGARPDRTDHLRRLGDDLRASHGQSTTAATTSSSSAES